MKIEVKASAIKAVSLAMARGDVRERLNGLYVEVSPTSAHLVATDNYRMHIMRVGDGGEEWSAIIPRDEVIAAVRMFKTTKNEDPTVTIEYDGSSITMSSRWHAITTSPIDELYPDWRLTVPRSITGECAEYCTKFVADADEAIRILGCSQQMPLYHNGNDMAGVKLYENFLALIMPLRVSKEKSVIDRIFAIL